MAPENTIAAFRMAVKVWGVDMLETDAHLTMDGEVVLIHDPTVDRTCNGTGSVASMSCERLQALDAGFHFRDLSGATSFRVRGVRVPTLDEVLEEFPHTRVNVETKSAEVERWRRHARGYTGPWGASRRDIALFWCACHARMVGMMAPVFDVLQVPERWHGLRVVTPRFVSQAHGLNIAVHVWVVDDEKDMRRLLDWGVDGVQTDRLDTLGRVLADVGGRHLSSSGFASRPASGPASGSEVVR